MDPDIAKIAELAATALATAAGALVLWGIARWITARTARPTVSAQRESLDDSRLARLETAVDAIAVEVERISESQRFATKMMAQRAKKEQLLPGEPR